MLLILFATLLLAQQEHKSVAPNKQADTWERSKECSVQAEKIARDRNERSVANGGQGALDWSNHYSPKFGKCYVRFDFLSGGKDIPKGSPSSYSYLVDAFERSQTAIEADGISPEVACRGEKDPKACEEVAESWWRTACWIEEKSASCQTAKAFIEDHMKN